MKKSNIIPQKILTLDQMLPRIAQWRILEKKIVFTNGVFDLLHAGHIQSLSTAAAEGDYLIVGVNSDASVKRLKGDSRPLNGQNDRALLMAALLMVDAVVIFEEDTPLNLITTFKPDVLVKGGDYTIEQIVGAREVIAFGGRVVINPILQGFSTTGIIEQMGKQK
jgi:D-beta-D-heptose 7-phosphate kinase/D-beta-D-heptose 1-phosphate adenosyltransferase